MAATDSRRSVVVDRLVAAGCVAAEAEAADLLAAGPDAATLDAWVSRREAGEPVAWITETTFFCGHHLHIRPGVYVPRPQSEALARRAASLLPDGGHALDLCTGAGAIAAHLHAEVPTATVIGVDRDVIAVACARRNGVSGIVGDLVGPIAGHARFDVVTAVAPYVPTPDIRLLPRDVQRYEPRFAIDGGRDGLDLVRRVVVAAGQLLVPGGRLLVEIGGEQDRELAPDLAAAGFTAVASWHDDDGDLRGISARAGG